LVNVNTIGMQATLVYFTVNEDETTAETAGQ